MNKRIKLLFVLGSMHNGGTEAFVMNYFRQINDSKFKIDFLVVQGDELYYKDEIESNGSHIFHISQRTDGQYYKNFSELNMFFSNHEYDIIHIHSCSLRFLAFITIIVHKTNSIIIGHSHSIGESSGTIIDKSIRLLMKIYVSHFLDYGMACSAESAASKFTSRFIKSNKYIFIPNAIDTNKYAFSIRAREKIRKMYRLENKYVIGIVGRIDNLKNQAFLLDVLKILKKYSDLRLIIIGDGEIKNDLIEKAKNFNISEKVIFTGSVTNAHEFYSALDLFCLPSYVEGFPFVLVEAQANGLYCLVSDGISKETDISNTIKFMTIKNPYVWAEEIYNCYSNPCRISNEDIDKVRKKYDISIAVDRLELFYSKIILKRG